MFLFHFDIGYAMYVVMVMTMTLLTITGLMMMAKSNH